MVILTDCFKEKLDEGCIKVANSLSKRFKDKKKSYLISYGEKTACVDEVVKTDKAFLAGGLYKALAGTKGSILFLPFSSNSKGGIVKTFFLAKKSKRDVFAVFTLRHTMQGWEKSLLRASNAKVITLSKDSYDYFREVVGDKAVYLKTGIDTKRFKPVSVEEKNRIREKYGLKPEDKVVIHVGHLKEGRNVDKLLSLGKDYKAVLVVSSVTQKDEALYQKLKENNVIIIDSYVENIQEVYQMADVYFFPVEKERNSIDVPLSVLEAAACNIPVVCTRYGELKEFEGRPGFFFLGEVSEETVQKKLNEAIEYKDCNNRDAIMEYDWDNSVNALEEILGEV